MSNSPSFEDKPVMEFFQNSTTNLLAEEAAAGVKHHVALSVVGTDRLQAAGYFRAKLVQENLIKDSGIPYTIVRATQFFEFVGGIAHTSAVGDKVHLPLALMQPILSDDVAAVVAETAASVPRNGTFDLAGPDPITIDDVVRMFLAKPRAMRAKSSPIRRPPTSARARPARRALFQAIVNIVSNSPRNPGGGQAGHGFALQRHSRRAIRDSTARGQFDLAVERLESPNELTGGVEVQDRRARRQHRRAHVGGVPPNSPSWPATPELADLPMHR